MELYTDHLRCHSSNLRNWALTYLPCLMCELKRWGLLTLAELLKILIDSEGL